MIVTASWFERLLDGSLFAGGIFLVIGIVGAVLLIVSVLLDGIFDLFDFGDGPLSLTTIAAFTAIFGFAAFGTVGAGASTGVAAVVGAVAGVVGGAAAWWLSRLIRSAESTTTVSSDELVGSEASVVLGIPVGGLGEVALVRHGERISLAASGPAETAIPRGSRVRILQTLTSTSVLVEPVLAEPVPVDPAPAEPAPAEPEPPAEADPSVEPPPAS
jgi:membrane-bound ClpP family serine protease